MKKFQVTPLFSLKLFMVLLKKIRRRGVISTIILDYFNSENPKFGRFYLQSKIHKRKYVTQGTPVISKCRFYTENISAFQDHQLKPIAMQVKSYISNYFLKKTQRPPRSTRRFYNLYNFVGLQTSIPNEDGLRLLNVLEKRSIKNVSTDTLIEIAELVIQEKNMLNLMRYLK